MRILVVEDDAVLSEALAHSLRSFGHAVDALDTGAQADLVLGTEDFDVVILDIEIPVLDGFEVLSRLRGRNQQTPVLILTARDAVRDRIHGLNMGADDYLTKPFDMNELEARVRAITRRRGGHGDNTIRMGDLVIDMERRSASVNFVLIEFSAREFDVLAILAERAGKVVSKEALMGRIYEWDSDVLPNAVEIAVHRIRRKLRNSAITVRTIRGIGYLLGPAGSDEDGV